MLHSSYYSILLVVESEMHLIIPDIRWSQGLLLRVPIKGSWIATGDTNLSS
jgi:hypothetical protein